MAAHRILINIVKKCNKETRVREPIAYMHLLNNEHCFKSNVLAVNEM
jgi:hypothetical protein